MAKREATAANVAADIRRLLKDGGTAEHAAGVQWFFKEEIKSHGWYTADLRRAAVKCRRAILKEFGLPFLLRAAHEALVHSLISPMVVAKSSRTKNVFRWAKSRNRWQRRAACVALIRGARQKMFFAEIKQLTAVLLADEDDMVQKGL